MDVAVDPDLARYRRGTRRRRGLQAQPASIATAPIAVTR